MNASSPCTPQEGLIPGPAGSLEILLTCPKSTDSLSLSTIHYPLSTHPANPYAVVCHPHPLHGGALTNKVVYMIANTFNALGVGTVRFNFRGVGRSTGHYDHGNGETEDLAAVVKWLRTECAPTELWLAGFSFGSYIALRAHQELGANRLLLVAPAVDKLDFSGLQISSIPTLIIQGERDDFS